MYYYVVQFNEEKKRIIERAMFLITMEPILNITVEY